MRAGDYPAPGEFTATTTWDIDAPFAGRTITIDRADPVIRISAEVLTCIRAGHDLPGGHGIPGAELDGWKLTIRGDNRTVIYVIDPEPDLATLTHLARWPD